jgi:multidrug efflux pump subunit AcrA (membrane-fusion protein)
VRSGQVVFVTAPFDGFLERVEFEVGDTVAAGAPLVTFDTRELLVRQAAELAEMNRFTKEVERARAQNALADMRVAEAQLEQARAVLERTRFHLEQAVIAAPIDGVIVEGDLRKRLGSPVRQGEVLLQTARLDDLYLQIEIPEREVHEVLGRTEGRMLFAAQADRSFPVTIERILPGGLPGQAGVVFLARAHSDEPPPAWWRPGMSGDGADRGRVAQRRVDLHPPHDRLAAAPVVVVRTPEAARR